MDCRWTTLQETLSSMQFRTVVLVSFGLETWQIAELLGTNEHTVVTSLNDSLRLTGCRDAQEIAVRAFHECHNDLYDEARLQREMGSSQNAAKKILERSAAGWGSALVN
jgi:DNA-binding CsgD family transcriptional regulator